MWQEIANYRRPPKTFKSPSHTEIGFYFFRESFHNLIAQQSWLTIPEDAVDALVSALVGYQAR